MYVGGENLWYASIPQFNELEYQRASNVKNVTQNFLEHKHKFRTNSTTLSFFN